MFQTIHERKAVVKTTILMVILFLLFFFVGMTYLDPPPELGIEVLMDNGAEVNYGTSDTGSGDIQPMTTQTPQQNASSSSNNSSSPDDTAVTQEVEDVPIVKTKTKVNTPVNNPSTTTQPKTTQPKTKKPDASTSNALNNILGAPSNTNQSSSGHGDDPSGGGDKGQIDGNPYATAFYGGGSGSGTGYGLNGRSKVNNERYTPECEEEGRVVVQIEVDKSGKVIQATPGVKGTTNSAPCLLEPAKKTAMSYKFNADSKAPNRQIGFVVINFSLGN